MNIKNNRIKTKSESKSKNNPSQRYLSLGQVQNLIDSIDDMRDKLLIKILYEAGCSLGELVNIRVSDINEDRIKIIGPDKNLRYSRISKKLKTNLSLYIRGNNISNESFVLSTKKSPKISVKRVRQLIQYYTEKAGFGKINPQMFRYYHIVHSYLSGVFIENISSQLGIQRYRIFQILTEFGVKPKKDFYDNFLNNLEEEK
jgi:integrase